MTLAHNAHLFTFTWTSCIAVEMWYTFSLRYGCTTGSPSGVIQHTGLFVCAIIAAILFSHAIMVVAPWFVTPMDPSVRRARYMLSAYSMSSSKSIFLSSRRDYGSLKCTTRTDNCPSICARAPTNVTPYTDVMTVCFTIFRFTSSPPRSSSAIRRIIGSLLFRSS